MVLASRSTARKASRWTLLILLGLAVSLAVPSAEAQKKDKSNDLRDITGTVTDVAGKPAPGAVVQLKNKKTLQIISFIAKDQGDYYFHGLSPDIEFEVSAYLGDKVSGTRTLSTFDSRRQAVFNLKLEHDRKP